MNRFLVVDDDSVARLLLGDFLSEFAPCDTAADGKEAFYLFETALAEGKPYSLLCIDLMMPEMDGHTLIRKIREFEKAHPVFSDLHTVIFVITASSSTSDRADLLQKYQCDDYLTKPFSRNAIAANLYENGLVFNRV